MRLIDANNLGIGKVHGSEACLNQFAKGWNSALQAVCEASPTVDPETLPIVKELREQVEELRRLYLEQLEEVESLQVLYENDVF